MELAPPVSLMFHWRMQRLLISLLAMVCLSALAAPNKPNMVLIMADGVSFYSTLFHTRRHQARSFAFSEGRVKAWVRTKQYKLYNDGKFYNVSADAFEKKPLKDVAGRATKDLELLRAAMQKLNFPKQK